MSVGFVSDIAIPRHFTRNYLGSYQSLHGPDFFFRVNLVSFSVAEFLLVSHYLKGYVLFKLRFAELWKEIQDRRSL
jgi:hypothetical protein